MKIKIKLLIYIFAFFVLHFKIYSSTGVIRTFDGRLHYYKNSKYIKTLKRIYDSNFIFFNSGENYYLSYYNKFKIYTLEKCNFETNICNRIGTPYRKTNPIALSFFDNGNGYVLTSDNKIDYFKNNKYVNTLSLSENKIKNISITENSLYYIENISNELNKVTSSNVYKCDNNSENCNGVFTVEDNLKNISFIENGEGIIQSDSTIYYFINDSNTSTHSPVTGNFLSSSFDGKNIYAIAAAADIPVTYSININNGNNKVIYKRVPSAIAISFHK